MYTHRVFLSTNQHKTQLYLYIRIIIIIRALLNPKKRRKK